ncbi:MAG: DUF1573 domain-containing protein [Chitinophagaceae bacterium]
MMRKYFFLVMMMAWFGLGIKAQVINGVVNNGEKLVMKELSFDFGKIVQGHPVTHEFEVSNPFSDTLKIENVQASCGCTTPVWKNGPVAPGGVTTINVGYNAAAEGTFDKLISIYYNGGQIKTFAIKGNVYKPATTPAPPNSSILLLKQTKQ